MKQIHVRATFSASPTQTVDTVGSALRALGASDVQLVTIDIQDLPAKYEEVWVMVTGDEADPYYRAARSYDMNGSPITEYEMQKLRSLGVCTQICIQCPNTDKYAPPELLSNHGLAILEVTEHLFAISSGGLEVSGIDSGDDSMVVEWLCIAMPVA